MRERERMLGNLPLQYADGPEYCTVTDTTGGAFALTVQPELMKLMEQAVLRWERETIARALYDRRFGAGAWDRRKSKMPAAWPSHTALTLLADADAILALDPAEVQRSGVLSEDERHAIRHARHQTEQTTAENPKCWFHRDLVRDLLRVIDRAALSPVTGKGET